MKHTIKRFLAAAILLCAFGAAAWSQARITVSGVVSDEKNEPLVGVAVMIQGTTTGTVTNLDGTYSFSVPSNSIL